MKILGNIIWLIFEGFGIAVEYFISSLLLMITIIGIPFGIAIMRLGYDISICLSWPISPTHAYTLCGYSDCNAAVVMPGRCTTKHRTEQYVFQSH